MNINTIHLYAWTTFTSLHEHNLSLTWPPFTAVHENHLLLYMKTIYVCTWKPFTAVHEKHLLLYMKTIYCCIWKPFMAVHENHLRLYTWKPFTAVHENHLLLYMNTIHIYIYTLDSTHLRERPQSKLIRHHSVHSRVGYLPARGFMSYYCLEVGESDYRRQIVSNKASPIRTSNNGISTNAW